MSKIVDAEYDHGIFKLIKPLGIPGLKDHDQIKLIIIPKKERQTLALEELLEKPAVEGPVKEMANEEIVEDV